MNSKIFNILIGIVVVVILGLAYMYSGGSGGAVQSGLTAGPSGVSNVVAVFLKQISAIRKIALGKDVLSRPELDPNRGLRDQGRELIIEEFGRENPFAPIGGQDASLQSALGSNIQNPPAQPIQIPIETPAAVTPLTD